MNILQHKVRSSITALLIVNMDIVSSGRGFYPGIVYSIEQVRDPFIEADHGGLSFRDMFVDLNDFYGNIENYLERENKKEELPQDQELDNTQFGLKYDLPFGILQHKPDDSRIDLPEPEYDHKDSPDTETKPVKYLRKRNYLPVMPTKDREEKTGDELTKMTRIKYEDDWGDDILEKWVDLDSVKNVELQRINKIDTRSVNIPVHIQYNQKERYMVPKLATKWKNKNKQYAEKDKKSLYSWYQKMKDSGRFTI